MQATNTLGKYHIIRELARSNDIVYEAMDPSRGKRIALKELQIPPNLTGQARQERIQRFTREARAAARLQHTNIVRIHDHGQERGRYYIAMEFLEGQSLRDVLRQRGALPLQEALRVVTAVADGLEFAHKNGVVHRDVKPDNVHLEPDGRVVITDFGIARLTFEPTLTAAGQIFGTPSYMSPEQVTGKEIDRRSDIFSLGVMLYEMVAGRKPFTGDSVVTITYNIMNVEAPPVTGAPPGIDQIIRKALAKEPARRYQSAAEMAEDLRLVVQGRPPRHASAPSPPPRSSSPAGRTPSAASRPSGTQGRGAGPAHPSPAPTPRSAPQPYPPRAGGPVPGARPIGAGAPLPPSATYGSRYTPGVPNPAPPAGFPGAAAPAPTAGGTAPHLPLHARPASRQQSGWDFKWFLGWLGVAIVVAGLVLLMVWASVTAYDKFQQNTASLQTERRREAADAAYREQRYDRALRLYTEVANGSRGERRVIALGNAAAAAVKLAEAQIKAGQGAPAEASARRALQCNPDSAAACVALGRSLALQDRVDEAIAALDQAAPAAERVNRSAAADEEKRVQREAANHAHLWKADILYKDGEKQAARNPELARRRFMEVMRIAPNSDYSRGADAHLQRLQYSAPAMAPAGANTNPGTADPGTGNPPANLPAFVPDLEAEIRNAAPPQRPSGWDPGYQNWVPR